MTCNFDEVVFAISTIAFVLSALYSSWQGNAIISILAIRHRGMYQALGKPHPLLTAESDRHSIALTLFVLSRTHEVLGDSQLSRAVRLLRTVIILNLLSAVLVAGCLLASDSPRSVVAFACWS